MTEFLAPFLNLFPEAMRDVVLILIQSLIVILPLTGAVAYLTLAERKVIGYMQVRIGPNRVGPRGAFQPLADMVKLVFKEIIVPSQANKFILLRLADHHPDGRAGVMGRGAL